MDSGPRSRRPALCGALGMIRSKKRKTKEVWRTGAKKLDSKGMALLRSAACKRSGGLCECGGRKEGDRSNPIMNWRQCDKPASWIDGQMHHIVPRSAGGSDEIGNVEFLNRGCHVRITGDLHFTRRTS